MYFNLGKTCLELHHIYDLWVGMSLVIFVSSGYSLMNEFQMFSPKYALAWKHLSAYQREIHRQSHEDTSVVERRTPTEHPDSYV